MTPAQAKMMGAPSLACLCFYAKGGIPQSQMSERNALVLPKMMCAPGLSAAADETGDTTNLSFPTLAKPQMLCAPSIRSLIADGWDTTNLSSPGRATREATQ